MAQQPQSPSMSLQDGHQNDHHHPTHIKSNADVPVDPNIAASSPTYPPYSPYAGHDMSHYQGHAPPPGYPQHWPQQYAGHPHGMPGGPYSSPGTGGSAQGTPASAGPRSSQVCRDIPSTPLTLLIQIWPAASPAIPGLFIRADSGRPATQASASPLRGDRTNVQVWVARM